MGGKLLSYYVTFGQDDWLVILECPDDKAAATVAFAASAGGGVDVQTTRAMTTQEAMAALKIAGDVAKSFKSAGK